MGVIFLNSIAIYTVIIVISLQATGYYCAPVIILLVSKDGTKTVGHVLKH